MRPKTEEFLYLLLWTCEKVTRPTFRNLTGSFEGWVYRNGLDRQVTRLERRNYLETKGAVLGRSMRDERQIRLTQAGRLHALGGRDPEARWKRRWDGRWRLVVFDVPISHRLVREQLRNHLRRRGFGRVQKSVWITPDPITEEKALLASVRVDVRSLLFWEGCPCAGETDHEIVTGAWDFSKINRAYLKHRSVLDACPTSPLRSEASARAFQRWWTAERLAWLQAVTIDPLLPEPLLPEDYLGQNAWKMRCEVVRKAGEKMRGFGSVSGG
jgi:phenylacetic acid degradation operon negative regulatory protein